MKIYDISQPILSCEIYPGDPSPELRNLSDIKSGDLYNLTAFSMCAHNGTHIDAPLHFINGGKGIGDIPLEKSVGYAYVAKREGKITAAVALEILEESKLYFDGQYTKRILIGGDVTVTNDGALTFAEQGILLIGNESQTVGPKDAPMQTHLTLLEREIVILEGIRLGDVPTGRYLLSAAPLNLGKCDGAPCRALLISPD